MNFLKLRENNLYLNERIIALEAEIEQKKEKIVLTTVMEGFKYPTLSLVVPLYNQLMSDLKACSENSQKRSQLELLL